MNSALQRFAQRETELKDKVVALARSIEPVLRDEGKNHLADRLAAVIDEIDRVQTEVQVLIRDNAEMAVKAMLEEMMRRRP